MNAFNLFCPLMSTFSGHEDCNTELKIIKEKVMTSYAPGTLSLEAGQTRYTFYSGSATWYGGHVMIR